MKYINVYWLLLLPVFLTCCGQKQPAPASDDNKNGTNVSATQQKVKDSFTQASLNQAGISKETDLPIEHSSSPLHNVLHEFTYLVAMRNFCDSTLLQMRDDEEVNTQLSKRLEKELLKAKAALASSKFNGLKIESGLYELFLKQIGDGFKE